MTVDPILPQMPIMLNMNYAFVPNIVGQYSPVALFGPVFSSQAFNAQPVGYNFDFNNFGNSDYNYGDMGSGNFSTINPQLFSLPQNNIFANYQALLFDNSQYTNNNTNWGIISKPGNSSKKLETASKSNVSASKVSLSKALDSGLKFVSQKHKDRWDNMDTTMQNELIKLADYAKSKGITIYINSSVRTEAEQKQLIASGAPAAKKGSKHLTGRAVDIKVSGDRNTNLAILGKYWRDQLGHRWGQDFKHPKPEPWHFDIG